MKLKLIQIEKDDWEFRDPDNSSLIQEQFDNAWEFFRNNEDHALAEIRLKKIIEIHPYHIDTLHHLSLILDEDSRSLEGYLCCREAVRIGLSAIPKSFSWKKSRMRWLHLDNRPFIRAYHNLGLWHHRRNELDLSIDVFSRLTIVCPYDNLWIRCLLPELWFKKGDVVSIINLCEKYRDDCLPEITYNYPLALVLSGETDRARKLLVEAKSRLPLVAKELRKKRHIQPKTTLLSTLPSYGGTITLGGADQAYEYWKRYGIYWSQSKEATALLLEK